MRTSEFMPVLPIIFFAFPTSILGNHQQDKFSVGYAKVSGIYVSLREELSIDVGYLAFSSTCIPETCFEQVGQAVYGRADIVTFYIYAQHP